MDNQYIINPLSLHAILNFSFCFRYILFWKKFISFRFVSFGLVSFRFYFVSHFSGTLDNNIWYKYTGITWQKDKYLMADKKLRIPRKLKTETHKQLKIRTDMNSDAPYESAVQTSLIPLHVWKSRGQLPSLLLKIEGGIVLPPFRH